MHNCGLLEMYLNVLQQVFYKFESVRKLKYPIARETFYIRSAN